MHNIASWIRWERDEAAYQMFQRASAVETLALRRSMQADAMVVPQYPEAMIVARKLGLVARINSTEPTDAELQLTQYNFAKDAAVALDNMCLGFTGHTTAQTHAAYSYDTLYVPGKATQGVEGPPPKTSLRDKASNRFAIYRNQDTTALLQGVSNYVRDAHVHSARIGIIAHPYFRRKLGRGNTYNELPVFYTTGATATTEISSQPEGNPLLFIGSMQELTLGLRSGPETTMRVHDDAWVEEAKQGGIFSEPYDQMEPEEKRRFDNMLASDYGTTLVKSRIRRGFYVPEVNSFHCFEVVD